MPEEKKSTYTGQTDARRKASAKYLREVVEDIRIRVPKGEKAKVQSHAERQGESMNAFVVRAITSTMTRDNLRDVLGEPSLEQIRAASHVNASPIDMQLTEFISEHGTPEQIARAGKGGYGNSMSDIAIEIIMQSKNPE